MEKLALELPFQDPIKMFERKSECIISMVDFNPSTYSNFWCGKIVSFMKDNQTFLAFGGFCDFGGQELHYDWCNINIYNLSMRKMEKSSNFQLFKIWKSKMTTI